eukprot:EG_transcript_2928
MVTRPAAEAKPERQPPGEAAEEDTEEGEEEEVSDLEWETEESEAEAPAGPPGPAAAAAGEALPQPAAAAPKLKSALKASPATAKAPLPAHSQRVQRPAAKAPAQRKPAQATSDSEEEEEEESDLENRGYLAGDRGEGYVDDQDSDSSLDEQGYRNRIGDVPLKWYEGYDHIGYDVQGNKIPKPTKSALEKLLERVDDPEALRTLWDPVEHESHRLSDRDLAVLNNIMHNRYPNPEFDPYPDMIEYVHWKPGENPFDMDRPKSQFVPNKTDRKIVMRYLRSFRRAQRRGIPINRPRKKTDRNAPFLLWDDNVDDLDPAVKRRQKWHIPPPKVKLPGHEESYNPPPEFLPSRQERIEYKSTHPRDRKRDFLPRKFACLRHVPSYEKTIEDRYRRCLDLFAVTRSAHYVRKFKDPDQLLPKLPSPQDLRPYPCRLGMQYKGHQGTVRSVSPDPQGEWLATGCDDCVVRVFEVTSGKLVFAYKTPAPVTAVEFSPNPAMNLLACTAGNVLYLFVPRVCGSEAKTLETVKFLRAGKVFRSMELEEVVPPDEMENEELPADEDDPEKDIHLCDWKDSSPAEAGRDLILKLLHHAPLTGLSFHTKGDYVAVVAPKDHSRKRGIVIHALSKRQSINPFKKADDPALAVKFFPTEAALFVIMTSRRFRIYNLLEQRHVKKLRGGNGQLCCMDIHAGAENRNIIAGSHDRTSFWYDLDWGAKPYRRMKAHSAAVRAVAYHPRPTAYPLFATASDDGQVHVYHATVFDDLTKNPLIVPLKILKGHKIVRYLGVQTCKFHPTLPWLFTGGGDGKVYLWVE